MSVSQYTAEQLIGIIRTRGGIPDANSEGTTDTDLLAYLNTEALALYGEVVAAHEDFFVQTDRRPLVAGSRYRIPHRALFGKVRRLMATDPNLVPHPLESFHAEDLYQMLPHTGSSLPTNFYLEGMYISLLPAVQSVAGNLDITYLFRPGELVMSTDCRQVVSIAGGVLTLASAIPSSWTTGTKFDVHSSLSGAEPKNWSIVATGASGSTVTFAQGDVDGTSVFRFPVEVGDWVCLEEQAALPGIPRELHPVLAQAVICRILERKDKEAFAVSRAELTNMLSRVKAILALRNEGQPDQLSGLNSAFFRR